MNHFPANILKLRTARGFTQQQMADALKFSRPALGSYEEGRACPRIERLIEIAEYFELTIDQLITKEL